MRFQMFTELLACIREILMLNLLKELNTAGLKLIEMKLNQI